jgi:hypothetical protein
MGKRPPIIPLIKGDNFFLPLQRVAKGIVDESKNLRDKFFSPLTKGRLGGVKNQFLFYFIKAGK